MKNVLIVILFTWISIFSISSQDFKATRSISLIRDNCRNQNLGFIPANSIRQLVSDIDRRFDLSGMVYYQGKILAIADKEWNRYIYQIDYTDGNFTYSPYLDICPDFNIDIEGIDYSNKRFYLIEEYTSDVYQVYPGACKMEKLEIPWAQIGVDRSDWGNKGFEGLAIDGQNQILYLAKEREPRRIFRVDLKSMEITEPFIPQLVEGGGHDISDMKYENGYLYILERGLGQITRINTGTKAKVSVSFQYFDYKDGQRLFKNENPQFGMTESFIFKNDEIWIGVDNNGDPVSDYGKSVGLKEGNKTAIMIFKRPEGF